MRYLLSIFAAVVVVAAGASAARAGVPITLSVSEGSPGTEVVIRGHDIGVQEGKNVSIFFATSESFFMFLDVIDWSSSGPEDVIRARVPEFIRLNDAGGPLLDEEGNFVPASVFRLRSDVLMDPEGVPEGVVSAMEYLRGGSRRGTLAVRRIGVGGYANVSQEVDFTVAPASSDDILIRPPAYTPIPPMERSEYEGKREPMRATLEDESDIRMAERVMRADAELPHGNITSVVPSTAEPGTVITILGDSFTVQGDRVVTLLLNIDEAKFYMDLDVISWSENEIKARIPQMDSSMFRVAPFDRRVQLDAARMSLMWAKGSIMKGHLMLMLPPDRVVSNEWVFFLKKPTNLIPAVEPRRVIIEE